MYDPGYKWTEELSARVNTLTWGELLSILIDGEIVTSAAEIVLSSLIFPVWPKYIKPKKAAANNAAYARTGRNIVETGLRVFLKTFLFISFFNAGYRGTDESISSHSDLHSNSSSSSGSSSRYCIANLASCSLQALFKNFLSKSALSILLRYRSTCG